MRGDSDLLELADEPFAHAWASMEIEEREALPADVRARGVARYNAVMGPLREPAAPRSNPANPRPTARWPNPLDVERLASTDPPAPKFIIPDWGPAGYAWLLAGHGGAGKSTLALMQAVCFAAGVPFLGLPVARCRVLFLSCEDRESIVHWRLARICAHLGVDLASLRGWLVILDLVDSDTLLWASDRGAGSLTAGYGELVDRMGDIDVLIIDGVTDVYGGSEIDKAEVKRFVRSLVALVHPERGAVLLLGHVNRATAVGNGTTTEGYSGTTGWHNSVRARWYLYPEMGGDDDRQERSGNLVLELQKTNYGKQDATIRLAWDEQAQIFLPITQGSGYAHLDAAEREREEQDGILRALHACVVTGRVPAAVSGPRTAHHVLSVADGFPDTLRGGRGAKRRFWRHMEILRQRGQIVESEHKLPDRHRVAILLPAGYAGNAD